MSQPKGRDQASAEQTSSSPIDNLIYGFTSSSQTAPATPLAMVLSILGAAMVALGVFLPRFDEGKFPTIVDNTLIQAGWGYAFLGLALTTVFFVYQFAREEGTRFSVLAVGAITLIGAMYMGTGERLTLETSIPRGYDQFGKLPDRTFEEQASPGTGIFLVGGGGAVVTLGGCLLAGFALFGAGTSPGRIKTCPECAETVLADARKCKHCGSAL